MLPSAVGEQISASETYVPYLPVHTRARLACAPGSLNVLVQCAASFIVTCLRYDGPVELFTCFACLFGGPEVLRYLLAHPTDWLTEDALKISKASGKGFQFLDDGTTYQAQTHDGCYYN